MSDEQQRQEAFRRFVRETIAEEAARVAAPLRDSQQRIIGTQHKIQEELRQHKEWLDELQDVVFGNQRMRTLSIAERLDMLDKSIAGLVKERDSIASEIRGARRLIYIIGALLALPTLQVLGWLQPILRAFGQAP